MHSRLPKLCLSAAIVGFALSAGSAARAQDPSESPPPSGAVEGETGAHTKKKGTRVKVRIPVEAYYTSNLFHIKERRVAGFDSHLDPGQRFYGMSSVGDLVLRPGARALLVAPVGKKRHLELGVGADYYVHASNRIADYPKLRASVALDLGRHDTVGVDADLVPERFEKNHRVPFGPGPTYDFVHAYVREMGLAVRFDHEWTRSVATRLAYVLDQTKYDDPFHNRDELLNEGRASVIFDLGSRSRIEVGGGFGVSVSPGEKENTATYTSGLVVDRSFREILLVAKAQFAASPVTTLDGALKFRNRTFTTDVPEDLVHHQRSDQLYEARVGIDRRVSQSVSLGAFASFARDYSNRSDPNLTPDEAGYKELVIGAAAAWRFSSSGAR